MSIVDTDYENYEIRFSKANIAGIDYMEAVWVGAREPHEPGTDDYELWYARVELAMLKYLPDFELRRLSPIKHTD